MESLKESYKESSERRARETEERFKKDQPNKLIDSDFIRQCLENNVFGDALLFWEMFKRHFLFNKTQCRWLVWAGHHWQYDSRDLVRASAVKVATVYKNEAKQISQKIKDLGDNDPMEKTLKRLRKSYNDRAFNLKDVSRLTRLLTLACDIPEMNVLEEQIDCHPWLLPCPNGVINLKTGELENGRPEDFLVKACPIPFPKEGIRERCSNF